MELMIVLVVLMRILSDVVDVYIMNVDLENVLKLISFCDGTIDCESSEDELDCGTGCLEYEYTCLSGHCISLFRVCDGVPNCATGEDESVDLCGCNVNQFECDNGKCILGEYVCDGDPDCPYGEDEDDCGCDEAREFTCPTTGACISIIKVCDGISDCEHGEDERLPECLPTLEPTTPELTIEDEEMYGELLERIEALEEQLKHFRLPQPMKMLPSGLLNVSSRI
uniref:SCO-spondin-like isoform X1 n=1 Tax=Saccoglossus kowalevskii TaxID=10224 RepID=A0ABM0MKY5_SACKO|nr:PREDICTED: SCO-spondin-like isoform X1 [Saccoglossus kowalevskii]